MEKFTRTDTSFLGSWWWNIDKWLLSAITVLIIIGFVLLFAASPIVAYRIGTKSTFFISKQMFFLPLALFTLFFFSSLNEKYIKIIASLIFAGALIAMVIVLFKGSDIKGSKRWINLLGRPIQPSEFMKPAFAVISSLFLCLGHITTLKIKERLIEIKGYMVAIFFWGLSCLLLILQPDYGMMLTVTAIFTAEIIVLGVKKRWFFILIGFGLSSIFLGYQFVSHVRSRIDGFLSKSPSDNYQLRTALEAFSNGGFFGRGPGEGQSQVPDAHTDFILAIAGEQFGFFLCFIILSLYVFILLRGISNIYNSKNQFKIIATMGLLTQFGFQAFVNMASTLGLIPTKGMTLPFISYGGSSLISTGILMGIILALCSKNESEVL
ncbi:MAG: Lipid II flippase FtsW [Alphaproteobacteria bacterium ADurb.Bin438]|nr:MAG: Lipid II flippase FtsW [Alphaproteobacteria bacterium ADurb.Bin438]